MSANVGFKRQRVRSLLSPIFQNPKDPHNASGGRMLKSVARGAYLLMICRKENRHCSMVLQAGNWVAMMTTYRWRGCALWISGNKTDWERRTFSDGLNTVRHLALRLFLHGWPYLLLLSLPDCASAPQPPTPGHSNLVPPQGQFSRHSLCQNDLLPDHHMAGVFSLST